MPRLHRVESSVVNRRHRGDPQPLRDGDDCRVAPTEREIGILQYEFGHAAVIALDQLDRNELAVSQRSEKAGFDLRACMFTQVAAHFGDCRGRD